MVMFFALLSLALFTLGYYLGNQLGSTAHIRERLRMARETQQTIHIKR